MSENQEIKKQQQQNAKKSEQELAETVAQASSDQDRVLAIQNEINTLASTEPVDINKIYQLKDERNALLAKLSGLA